MKRFIFMLLALLLCISQVFLFTTIAAQPDTTTYAIDLTVSFSDEDTKEITAESYQSCKFQIQNSLTKHYLIAQYSEADNCYVVSGSTVDKEAATVFSCGMDTDNPARLVISGMEVGRYWLFNVEAASGYTLYCRASNPDRSSQDGTLGAII